MSFDKAFAYLLGDEGHRYVNDPKDRGGPTKYGITKETYEAFYSRPATETEIENMDEATARQIYHGMFWLPIELDSLVDENIAIAIFDCAVLYSPKVSVMMAQKAMRTAGRSLDVDGVMGPVTLSMLNNITTFLFMTVFRGQILAKIDSIVATYPDDIKFRDGWVNRANRLLTLVSNINKGAIG